MQYSSGMAIREPSDKLEQKYLKKEQKIHDYCRDFATTSYKSSNSGAEERKLNLEN